ncbi:MAG: tRNA (adenosine(37)-N6)-threonylcarbamoyltransferase complex ATPase subunit type 1 TsaE [Acidimicrobiales bacterium]
MSTLQVHTDSPDATKAVAGALGGLAVAGDIFVLAGELGAGKTVFAQGFGAALGVTGPIVSPTFTIARHYEGARVVMHHLDVYRLERLREATDLGLAEMLDDGGVALIEWGDAITPVLPADFLEIRFSFGVDDDDRRLDVQPAGGAWQARMRATADALAPWTPSC